MVKKRLSKVVHAKPLHVCPACYLNESDSLAHIHHLYKSCPPFLDPEIFIPRRHQMYVELLL
jgi:hypothetical protein